MAQDPFMVRDLARHIAGDMRARHGRDVEVHADAFASLNGRPAQRLIDPHVDLSRISTRDWLVPLGRDTAAKIRLLHAFHQTPP